MADNEARYAYTMALFAELLAGRSQRDLAATLGIPQSRISAALTSGHLSIRNLLKAVRYAKRPVEEVHRFLTDSSIAQANRIAEDLDAEEGPSAAPVRTASDARRRAQAVAMNAIPHEYRPVAAHLLRVWLIDSSELSPIEIIEVAEELERMGRYFRALARANRADKGMHGMLRDLGEESEN